MSGGALRRAREASTGAATTERQLRSFVGKFAPAEPGGPACAGYRLTTVCATGLLFVQVIVSPTCTVSRETESDEQLA